MKAWKLMLATVGGGVLLGSIAGAAVSPVMKPGPEPTWRPPAMTTTITYRPVEVGPEDLSPPLWVQTAAPPAPPYEPRFADYRPDPEAEPALPEAGWNYDNPAREDSFRPARTVREIATAEELRAVEDAAAALEAARDASDQPLESAGPF